jgi:hypothetical protein
MPQGKVRFTITTAPRRPVRKPPQLMLAAPAPTIAALEREIAEVEERLLTLRAKLAGLTAQRGNGPKRRRASAPTASLCWRLALRSSP